MPPNDGANVACTWTLEANVTTNANTHLIIAAPVSVNGGSTLTINGPYTSLIGPDWYSGAGTVTFNYLGWNDPESYDLYLSTYVVSGGTHASSGSCTSGSFSTRYSTQRGVRTQVSTTIDYSAAPVSCNCANPGSDNAWVIARDPSAPGALGTFQRVGTTDYYVDCASATEPTLPADSVWLMRTPITNGALGTPDDLSNKVSLRVDAQQTRVYNVRNYGAVGNGTTDDTFAFRRVRDLLCASGGIVLLPPGNYAFASATGGVTFTNCANVTIQGAGPAVTTITVTGTANTLVFYFQNANNIKIQGIRFVGNDILPGSCVGQDFGTNGTAVYFDNTGAGGAIGDYRVMDNEFHSFSGNAVIKVQTVVAQAIEEVWIQRNKITGGQVQCVTSASIGGQAIWLLLSANGNINRYWVQDNEIEASGRHNGIAIQDNGAATLNNGVVSGNSIRDVAQDYAGSPPVNAYAIALYGGTSNVSVQNNTLTNPYTTGIYGVGVIDGRIIGNTVTGTDETNDATLMRGGIVCSTCRNVTINGNTLTSNFVGISVQPEGDITFGTVSGNTIRAGQVGIGLRRSNGVGGGISVTGNTITGVTANGIDLWRVADASVVMSDVTITGNTIDTSNSSGIEAATTAYNRLTIAGNTVRAGGTGAHGIRVGGSANQSIKIHDNLVTGGDTACIRANGFQDVSIIGNTLDGCGTGAGGFAFILDSLQGTLWGNIIVNLGAGAGRGQDTGAEDLGIDTPTWTGDVGTMVQKITATPHSYIGWVWDGTAWQQFGRTGPFAGASPGATCDAGAVFVDTDQTVDTNCATVADNSLCLCTATNVWTALENN